MIRAIPSKFRAVAESLKFAHFVGISAAVPKVTTKMPTISASRPAPMPAKAANETSASQPAPMPAKHSFDHLARCGDEIHRAMQSITQPTN